MDARSASMSSAKTYCSMRTGVVPNRDFDEADEYCPNCDNHFVIDAETKKSKAIKEGKAEPRRCEHCAYCRATKRLTAILDYREMNYLVE